MINGRFFIVILFAEEWWRSDFKRSVPVRFVRRPAWTADGLINWAGWDWLKHIDENNLGTNLEWSFEGNGVRKYPEWINAPHLRSKC